MADEKAKILLELGVENASADAGISAFEKKVEGLNKLNAGADKQSLENAKKQNELFLQQNESRKHAHEIAMKQLDVDKLIQRQQREIAAIEESKREKARKTADEYRRQADEVQRLNDISLGLQRVASGANRIGNIAGAGAAAILGGAYFAANREAQRLKEQMGAVDETTRRWLASQDRITVAYQRLSRVAMQELLPFLEKAASLAEKIAAYAEENPESVKAVLSIGAILAAVSVIAKFVAAVATFGSWVTKLVAGLKTVAAVETGVYSSRLAMAAAGASGTGGTTAVIGASSAGTIIGSALVYAIAAYVGAKGGEVLGNALGDAYRSITGKGPGLAGEGKYSAGDAAVGTAMLLQGAFYKLNEIMGASEQRLSAISVFFTKVDYAMAKLLGAERIQTVLEKLSGGILDLGESAEDATGKISGTANALQALGAYTAYVQANAEANAQYAANKAQIESTYTQQTETLYKNHAAAMAAINSSLAATLSSIEANYQAANIAAQAQYQADQASIIAQGATQVEQIIADSQERLAEMARDHAQRVEELTNDRDALGLAQENRRYKEEVAAEKARAQQAVAAAKKQTQQQLAELERRYQLEQQQRDAQYQLEMEQARAQAAQQLAEENAAFQAQLAQLQAAKEAELKQLEDAHKKELAENRRMLIQKLHDLGYYSQKELETARAYQETMLAELDAFWAAYADIASEGMNSISGASGTAGIDYSGPGYATGGYKYAGIYHVEKGKKEFMLNDSTTRAAESMIGSRLTQENMLASLLAGAGGGGYGNQMVNVNVAQGATLMQVKRKLDQNSRELSRNLEKAFRSI